jgi:SAM-dependent methyltransferase
VVADVTEDLQSLIADAYDRAAPNLARITDPLVYRILARPLVEAMVGALGPRSGRVLDVAAGSGAFGCGLDQVVALDLSAGQLRVNGAHDRVRADANWLPFPTDAFAGVGCSFGINHFTDPVAAVREMARVAPVVVLSTWSRPEAPYAPKRIVDAALEHHLGCSRSPVGVLLDELSLRVGSVAAVERVLTKAGLDARVREVEVDIPWAGADAFLDYRMSMPSSPEVADLARLRAEVREATAALGPDELTWRPSLVVGIGSRRSAG